MIINDENEHRKNLLSANWIQFTLKMALTISFLRCYSTSRCYGFMDVKLSRFFFLSHFICSVLFIIWKKKCKIPLQIDIIKTPIVWWISTLVSALMAWNYIYLFSFFCFFLPLLQQHCKVFSFTLQNSFFLVSLKKRRKSLTDIYVFITFTSACVSVRECACTWVCILIFVWNILWTELCGLQCTHIRVEWHLAFKLSKYGLKAHSI